MVIGPGHGRLGHNSWLGQLRDNDFLHAGPWYDDVPDAVIHLDDLCDERVGAARLPGAGRCASTRIHRPQLWGGRLRAGKRWSDAVAAPLLVFRSP